MSIIHNPFRKWGISTFISVTQRQTRFNKEIYTRKKKHFIYLKHTMLLAIMCRKDEILLVSHSAIVVVYEQP